MAKLMGGKIWVESEVGRGSQFHFTARFAACEKPDVDAASAASAHFGERRVLVVDANATNREILVEVLGGWGMKVGSASSVSEALTSLRRAGERGELFEILIADSAMSEDDGLGLLDQMQKDKQLATTPMVMLTTGDRFGAVARRENAGLSSCLLKPVKQSELRAAIQNCLGPQAQERADAPVANASNSAGRSLKILLAEDNIVNQKLAIGLLKRAGHEATVANNGREALDAWAAEDFDAVLMDVEMPEMDGLEATAAIREGEKKTGKHVPIIAMTAHAMQGDRERCLAAGMDDYLSKPIRVKLLESTLDSLFDSDALLDI
jgi:CheY-like chemotaxis protein